MHEDDPVLLPEGFDLTRLSLEDLEARLVALKDAMKACEAVLEKKRAHKNAADTLFGAKS